MEVLNVRHLKKNGTIIPPAFKGQIDQALLKKTSDYMMDKNRLGNYSAVFSHAVILLFVFAGVLNFYNHWIAELGMNFILSGLTFFLLLTVIQSFMNLPFSWYQAFKIETRYGFNTMTKKVWLGDFFKSLLISIILLSVLITVGLGLVVWFPNTWWILVWAFFMIFTLFIMYLSPYVLEPLFNKFTPIEDSELADEIKVMMQKAGLEVSRVFKMDASKRSRHTNAYFTGIGKVKRIVLYDTLIEKMETDEIVSVLAHEVGHWKKKHVFKRLVMTEVIGLAVIYLFYLMMQSELLLSIFFIRDNTFFVKLFLFQFVFSIMMFPLSPLYNLLSRNQEREADQFAVGLTGTAAPLIRSLVKLSKDNLSNLHPHPWYAAFHYSHPPVVERIQRLQEMEQALHKK